MFRFWAVDRRSAPWLLAGVAAALLPAPLPAQDNPGPVVRQLTFQGNKSINKLTLEAAIATTNSSFFVRSHLVSWLGLGEKRYFREREFKIDVARIRLLYQVSGFLDAKVDTVVRRTPKFVWITFKITENEPVRVRTFVIRGLDSVDERQHVSENLPLKIGAPYNRYLLLASADSIQLRLSNAGYPSAGVLLGRREVDRAAHTADLELIVDRGRSAVIGTIRIRGTDQVDTSFVRGLLATHPGKRYRQDDLYQSQLNLYQSGLFRFATVNRDTTVFMVGDETVPISVDVQEGPLHRARAQVGFGTNDCFRGLLGWTGRNFGHSGRQVDFSARVSKIGVGDNPVSNVVCSSLKDDTVGSRNINYGLSASFRRPSFLSPSNSITGTLFAERRSEFKVYLREDVGASIDFSRLTARRFPVTFGYRISYGSTHANAVSFCAFFLACRSGDVAQLSDRRWVATLTGSVSSQTVNSLLDPSKGSAYSLETTFSSPLIGSSKFSQFTRVVGDATWYRPVGGDVVVAARLRGGLIFAPELTLSGGAANFIPPDQRFYAGGSNDVRGFERNQLGPLVYLVDSTAVHNGQANPDSVTVAPIGGNTLAVGNLELRLPSPVLSSKLRWVVFVDVGGVWERGAGFGSNALLRVTPGIGLRFGTALGPVRLDAAYNQYDLPPGALYVNRGPDLVLLQNDYRQPRRGSPITFQLSVGQAF
jgi:outer membrane protein assembly complex protein YaeT